MTHRIPDTHPAISRLRQAVEAKYGAIDSSQKIVLLAENELHNRLNPDTIRRIWGVRHVASRTIYRSSLDILCAYVGYRDWEHFVSSTATDTGDSGLSARCGGVELKALRVGQQIDLVWQPNRSMQIQYEGENHFTILEVVNSSTLQAGDEFDCVQIEVQVPAVLSHLHHAGVDLGEYIIGRGNGLSEVFIR